MIGELIQNMLSEAFDGASANTKRAARLPYLAGVYNGAAHLPAIGAGAAAVAGVSYTGSTLG